MRPVRLNVPTRRLEQESRHLVTGTLLSLQLLLGVSVGEANEPPAWSQWRGPQRNGDATALWATESLPADLTSKWSVTIGAGHSGPVVSKDVVFTHTQTESREVVRALELSTGEEIWQQSYAIDFEPEGGGPRHGNHPRATPVVHGESLITLSVNGELRVWNTASGALRWIRDSSEFDARAPLWGHATSPIVVNDLVVAHLGGVGSGALMGLTLTDGTEAWRYDSAPSYSSPVLATIRSQDMLIATTEEGVVALDPVLGTHLWSFSLPQTYNLQNSITPVVAGHRVMVAAEDRGILALDVSRQGDQWKSVEAWRVSELSPDMSSPILFDGMLIGLAFEKKGTIFAVDIDSGEVLWRSPGRQGDYAALLGLRNAVILQQDSGTALVFRASPEGYSPVRTYTLSEGATWAHPAVVSDGLLVKDSSSLTYWLLEEPAQ